MDKERKFLLSDVHQSTEQAKFLNYGAIET